MIQSRLFLLRDSNVIHDALSDLQLCMMFNSRRAVTHCMKDRFQKYIIGHFK